jgi:hypothetical protein
MRTSSLSPAREALDVLLALRDEDGNPIGPTAEQDRLPEKNLSAGDDPDGGRAAPPADRSEVDKLFDRVREVIGIEELPEGSVHFSEWLREGEEEYPLRYSLRPVRSRWSETDKREEKLVGQLDIGKVLTFTRRISVNATGIRGIFDDENRLSAEVYQSRTLESGATVRNETTWDDQQLGPLELGAVVAFFQPAIAFYEQKTMPQ